MTNTCENCRQEIGECICMDGPEDSYHNKHTKGDYDDCSKDLEYEQQYKEEHMNLQEAQQVTKNNQYTPVGHTNHNKGIQLPITHKITNSTELMTNWEIRATINSLESTKDDINTYIRELKNELNSPTRIQI